ncbi:hypothetical protein BDC45DRAFT_507308 [Circinella umbellata]|nr:hypothetical protein BDC45DRAFT_507308 [Circinella umbellata]
MPPFMNRNFTCSCIITQEKKIKKKSMTSFFEQHKCTEQNDISSTTDNFVLPKRPWTDHNFFSTKTPTQQHSPPNSTVMPTTTDKKNPKKSSSPLSSSSAQQLPSSPSQPQRHDKSIKNLHEFLTSLLISPNPPSAQDTADFEDLVLLMKKHTLFDPTHIPQLQDIKRLAAELPCLIPGSTQSNVTNTISSNSNMNKVTSKNSNNRDDSNNNNKSSSSSSSNSKETTSYTTTLKPNVAPVPNFEFSFSSDRQVNFPPPPEKPLYTTDRPTYRRGGVYADEYDEVEDVKLEDEVDPEELEAIIQQRKILPLPKSRWSQKNATATVSDEKDKSNKEQNVAHENDQEIASGVALSSSSKPGTSIIGQQQERIAIRSSGGPSNRTSSSLSTTTTIKTSSFSSPLSEETQRFISGETIQPLKSDQKHANNEYDKKKNKLVFDKNLDDSSSKLEKEMDVKSIAISDEQQQEKFTSFRSETATQSKKGKSKTKKKKSSSVTKPTDHPSNDDHEHSKKNTKLSTTKKGKKSQHPLEQQQSVSSRKDWLDVDLNSSDVSMIKNGNSDEWICLFCQYEIFCSGWEATLRKRGGYRRRRRLLRAKDMNDSILQHHHKYASQPNVEEEEKDSLSPLVRMSVDTRIRIVAGIHKDLVFNDCNNENSQNHSPL